MLSVVFAVRRRRVRKWREGGGEEGRKEDARRRDNHTFNGTRVNKATTFITMLPKGGVVMVLLVEWCAAMRCVA